MFVSLVEPARQTSLNSLFAFIFCNLIILLGSKFSSSDSETQDALPGLRRYSNAKPAEIVDVERRPDQIERMSRPEKQAEEKLALVQASEVCNSEINRKEEQGDNSCEYEDEDGEYDDEAEKEDNGEEVNGDDDELRRRIEDFITKVNRAWKEENLKDRKPKLTLLDQPHGFDHTRSLRQHEHFIIDKLQF